MTRDLQATGEIVVKKVREDGIAVVDNYFDVPECHAYVDKLEDIFADRYAKGIYCGNHEYQVIYNYFQGRPDMFRLLYQDLTDVVMRSLIDDDYVLISPSARNRRVRSGVESKRATSGVGWHVDTRFVGAPPVAFRPSPIYFAVLALEDFTSENGATAFIRGSHQWYKRPEDRNAALDDEALEAKAGALIFFDSALWHKVGDPGVASRWSVFNMFGPWFIKPYFRFHEMFTAEEMESFPSKVRQLLHWDSVPPRDHSESTVTLRRVRKMLGQFAD